MVETQNDRCDRKNGHAHPLCRPKRAFQVKVSGDAHCRAVGHFQPSAHASNLMSSRLVSIQGRTRFCRDGFAREIAPFLRVCGRPGVFKGSGTSVPSYTAAEKVPGTTMKGFQR